MKVLVIGASGFLGSYLVKEFSSATIANSQHENSQYEVFGTSHRGEGGYPALDLASEGDVKTVLENVKPELILLSAGITNMDLCEEKPQECWEANVGGTQKVADYCKKHNAVLAFYSTDAVYDGKRGPYLDGDSQINPQSVYAKQKMEAEKIVAEVKGHLIIRTSSIYGWDPRGMNFIARLVSNLSQGKELTAPADQSYMPTYAPDLAHATRLLVEAKQKGVFNVAGSTFISRYAFALVAAEVFGLDQKLIKRVMTKDLNQKAARLEKGGLLSHKLVQATRFVPKTVRQGLEDMLTLRNSGISTSP